MSSQIEVRRRGRVGLQLKACENASGVSGWAFEGNKWMDERARCQKHPTRMSDGGLGWRTCHLLAWFPLGCSHTHVSRWNYERKKLGGDWMNWTCWRQGQGEWRVKNKRALRFLPWPFSSHEWRSECRWKESRGEEVGSANDVSGRAAT